MSAEATVEIKNRLGLHLRAASTLRKALEPFAATVTVANGNEEVNARSVVRLMTLGAALGSLLHVKAEGPDAEAALATVKLVFEQGFGED